MGMLAHTSCGAVVVMLTCGNATDQYVLVQVRKFELSDIIEACDEFCRDQHGSRFIQVT